MRKTIALSLLIIVAALAAACVAPRPAAAHDRAAVEGELLELINKARTSRGLHRVDIQGALDRAAIAHSRQMISKDYFSHDSAGGTSLGVRLRRAGYGRSGYTSWSVGEVLGWGTGTAGTAQAIMKAWMNSTGHRRTILRRRWRDVGIGCAQGTFKGTSGVLMYTVDFGRRTK